MIRPFVHFTLKNNDLVRVCLVVTADDHRLFYQVKVNAGSPVPDYQSYTNFAALPPEFKPQAALILATQRFWITPQESTYGDPVKKSVGAPYSVSTLVKGRPLTIRSEPLQEKVWFVPSVAQAACLASLRAGHDDFEFVVLASPVPGLAYPKSTLRSEDHPGMRASYDMDLEELIPWTQVVYDAHGPKGAVLRFMLASRAIAHKPLPNKPDTITVPAWHSPAAFAMLEEEIMGTRICQIPALDPVWTMLTPPVSGNVTTF